MLVTGVNIFLDFFAQRFRKIFDSVIDTADAVIRVYAQFLKEFTVLGEQVLLEDLDRMAKNDWMRDLHHRRLHMQGEHHSRFSRIFHLLFQELALRLLAHKHAIDDFTFQQGSLFLQYDDVAIVLQKIHFDVTGMLHGHAFFAGVEIA